MNSEFPSSSYDVLSKDSESTLSIAFKEKLKNSLIQKFPDLLIKEYFENTPNWFSQFDHLIFCVDKKTSDIIGVLSSKWRKFNKCEEYLHATAQFVAPQWQRSSMLRVIWMTQFSQLRYQSAEYPKTVVLKTCNPAAFAPMHKFSEIEGIEVYPNIHGSNSENMIELSKKISQQICPQNEFSGSTGVIKDISTPPDFYPTIPARKIGTKIWEYFLNNITTNDRILCIARINNEKADNIVRQSFMVKA